MDFDDLCDQWNPYDLLMTLKENEPALKVSLFTIPMKCSPVLIKRYKALSWVELAMHGWWHTTGETYSWSLEECIEKMKRSRAMGIDAGGFKAPKWLIDPVCYDAAREMEWWVADHLCNRFRPKEKDDRIYTTDLRLRTSTERRMHGHTHNVTGNGIEEAFASFMLPRGKFEYKFISEVV